MIEMVALVISRLKDMSPEALPPAASHMEVPASNGVCLHQAIPVLLLTTEDMHCSWQTVSQCCMNAHKFRSVKHAEDVGSK